MKPKLTTNIKSKSVIDNYDDQRFKEVNESYITFSLRTLHFLYCCCIILLTKLAFQIQFIPIFIITISICLPLIIDNMRYSFQLSEKYQHLSSQIAFFSHECITPFGLLYIPAILFLSSPISQYNMIIQQNVLASFIMITLFLAYQGLNRYFLMSDWKLTSIYGVSISRPNHTNHSALLPIFATVLGLITIGSYLYYHTQEIRYFILCVSQTIVFIGNGMIASNKILKSLFANLFEVIWLWSIIQSFL